MTNQFNKPEVSKIRSFLDCHKFAVGYFVGWLAAITGMIIGRFVS